MMRFSLHSPKVFRRTRSTSSKTDRYCPSLQRLCLCAGIATIVFSTTGCRAPRKIRTSDYVGVVNQVSYSSAGHSSVVAAVPPDAPNLGGPQPVDVYIAYALSQNPDIEVARKRVDVAAYRVPQAASLRDPTFGVTAFPEPVQTAAGQQEVALTASQHLPWFGKLSTMVAAAEADQQRGRDHGGQ